MAVATALIWFVAVGCVPGGTVPVVRIGLVAPFEGRYREIGYDVIPAIRMALYDAAVGGGVGGYMVELVAFDDGGDPDSAVEQAHKVTRDPTVLVVIGHWMEPTTRAASGIYAEEGVPLITDSATVTGDSIFRMVANSERLRAFAMRCLPDAEFHMDFGESVTEAAGYVCSLSGDSGPVIGPPLWATDQFRALAGDSLRGVYYVTGHAMPDDLPGGIGPMLRISAEWSESPLAYTAYDSAILALDAIARAASSGYPTRRAVEAALRDADLEGLTGHIAFDGGERVSAPVYVYGWDFPGRLRLVCGPDHLRRRTER